jgi:hypothetical protein
MNTQFFTPGRKLILLVVIGFAVIFSIKLLGPSLAKDSEQREIEDKIPKHLPLKVKIKKEKEAKVKDFENDQWVLDFELEVTNTSEKPIYFLSMYVLLPEFVQNGGIKGIPLRYGRMDFIKSATRPLPDDIPIKPGETYTFKIPDQDQEAWSVRKAAGLAPNPRKLRFIFSGLSFGDGTGFVGTTGLPYPRAKEISKLNLMHAASSNARKNKKGAAMFGSGRLICSLVNVCLKQDRQRYCRFAFLIRPQFR